MSLERAAKEKWVAALRSGEYAQGRRHLFHKKRYCCLGVAREVLGLRKRRGYEYLQFASAERIGLTRLQQEILGDLNDMGKSFGYIANYIERYY